MEKNNGKEQKINGIKNGFFTEIPNKFSWHVNITKIDISARNIDTLGDNVQLPANLIELNLSHNKLVQVPVIVSKLINLKCLDLSHNAIQYFDETPNFCHTLEQLDLSTNSLLGPPYWVWTEKPKNLARLNLKCNTCLTKSFVNGNLEELLQYKTLVVEVDLSNCGLQRKHTDLLGTFSNVKAMKLGTAEYTYHGANIVCEVPNNGLEKCSDVERLNLSNTHIYTINASIDKLKNLSELNLACNNINILPNEFCNLTNLETCILSSNNLLYLPDDVYKLNKLARLCLDSNELCMIPENLLQLPQLKALDLYDNFIYEIVMDISHLQELDVAMNYMDEPDDVDYLVKKKKIRLVHDSMSRCNGRKTEVTQSEQEKCSTESDDEYHRALFHGEISPKVSSQPDEQAQYSSSPEDWDSDSHWIPHDVKLSSAPPQAWTYFVKRKMQEGYFCPLDAHVVSVSEQVMYEKSCNPQVTVECVGQFDDYSSDES